MLRWSLIFLVVAIIAGITSSHLNDDEVSGI